MYDVRLRDKCFFNTCISNLPPFLLNISMFVIKKLSFPNQISASNDNQFTVYLWTHFWTLLVHGSLWPSVYQYLTLDFCSFKIKYWKSSLKKKALFMLYPLHFLVNFERLSVSTKKNLQFSSFSSVAQLCPTLCDPMNRSTPGFPVHHQLLEFTQTHVHRVGDAIQPSHPLSSPSLPAPNPSQHQGLFQWVNALHEVAKYWSFSFSIIPSSEHPGLILLGFIMKFIKSGLS